MIDSMKVLRSDSIYQALRVIDQCGKGACFVVDDQGILCGVLTDGDIRRALLAGRSIDVCVGDIVAKNYVFASNKLNQQDLLKKVNSKIKIIPIVNEKGELVDFFEANPRFYAPIAAPDISGNELTYVIDCIATNWISSQGKYVTRFEEEFANYCGSSYGIAVMNGTVALHLALEALEIGAGDEVIVPDLTFAATINSVIYSGATPVIVDVESDSWGISPVAIRKAITSKTKAIIPVHLYGQPCDMMAIKEIASEFGLYVIEDCAEAHGAKIDGSVVGTLGDIGCYSFFGNKVITTGEGGMCITNSPQIASKLKILRDHGMSTTRKYWHDMVGYNYRMTNLQAAIGCAQLENIDVILPKREKIEKLYINSLNNISLLDFQKDIKDRSRIVWMVSCLLNEDVDRAQFINGMKDEGIDLRPFFYTLSSMPIYKSFLHREGSPFASNLSSRGINLPTITKQNNEFYYTICDKISSYFNNLSI